MLSPISTHGTGTSSAVPASIQGIYEVEDLLGLTTSIANFDDDVLENDDAIKSFEGQSGSMTLHETALWAKTGCVNPDIILALRSQGIVPFEVSRQVSDESGGEMTIMSAIETGKIPTYDVATACATYPGTGWFYDAERFAWSRRLSTRFLSGLVRNNLPNSIIRDPGDDELGARMATS